MTAFHRRPTWIVMIAAVAVSASWADHGRADAPIGRYTITNGTVYDTKTLLTWQQYGSSTNYTWTDAQTYCATLDFNGTGWRVPSMKELLTIVDETRESPAIDGTVFPNTPSFVYHWTSSAAAGDSTKAWAVVAQTGASGPRGKTYTSRVRCVR